MKVVGERAAGAERSMVLQKVLLVMVVTTAVLCAALVLAGLCGRGVQYCCHINSHQIIPMKSIIMLKAHIHVGL